MLNLIEKPQNYLKKTHNIERNLITTPIGLLALLTRDNKLTGLKICRDGFDLSHQKPDTAAQEYSKNIHDQVELALKKYFDQQIPIPNFPFELHGTPFQEKVWLALCRIPFGQMRTYGELAELLNTSAQAVGNACRENPIPIIIPCHRVVSQTRLGGVLWQGFRIQNTNKDVATSE